MTKQNKALILIVEDDETIVHVLKAILNSYGYKVITASGGGAAKTIFLSQKPDAVLLDLGLPDMDGMELLEWIRRDYNTPVLIVSARESEEDKVRALDLGADDYITKPFGTAELLARIRTAFRHQVRVEAEGEEAEEKYEVGDLVIDFTRRMVLLQGKQIHLTQTEYKIVELIARRPGRVLTYDTIIRNIWGEYAVGNNRILRVNMAHIRRKLEENPTEPQYILTEIGIGYRMVEE